MWDSIRLKLFVLLSITTTILIGGPLVSTFSFISGQCMLDWAYRKNDFSIKKQVCLWIIFALSAIVSVAVGVILHK